MEFVHDAGTWRFHCRNSSGDGGAARPSKTSARAASSGPGGELNEDILSSLGQLLTSSASSLGELLKVIPSVSRLSRSMTTTSDGCPVKKRRLSTSTLDNLLARSGDESPAAHAMKHVTDDQSAFSPSCFTGLFACRLSQSTACLGYHWQSPKADPGVVSIGLFRFHARHCTIQQNLVLVYYVYFAWHDIRFKYTDT